MNLATFFFIFLGCVSGPRNSIENFKMRQKMKLLFQMLHGAVWGQAFYTAGLVRRGELKEARKDFSTEKTLCLDRITLQHCIT